MAKQDIQVAQNAEALEGEQKAIVAVLYTGDGKSIEFASVAEMDAHIADLHRDDPPSKEQPTVKDVAAIVSDLLQEKVIDAQTKAAYIEKLNELSK